LGLLASELAGAADRFSLLPVRFFGRLLVKSSALHLAKNTLALHFLLEYPQSLVDVVVANEYLQETFLSCSSRANCPNQMLAPARNDGVVVIDFNDFYRC
jgi:hypothetical protein